MLDSNSVAGIYRHFKGGYYVVLHIASQEADGELQVVYQSLQDGRVWVRPVSVFSEPVPEGKENPTGQFFRFQKVTNFDNQLNMLPTEVLLNELKSRKDCPVELLENDSDKIAEVSYLVGNYEKTFLYGDHYVENFNTHNVFTTLERAQEEVKNFPNLIILKRVLLKQDFDF